ncbi:MAG: hypothetical protein ACI8PZ_003518 [Myxococcota bacterium]
MAAPVPPQPVGVTTVTGSTDGTSEVRLGFEGVGPLHQGFFSQDRFVLALGRALAPCGAGPHEVMVSYDTERRIGHIELVVQPRDFGCLPAPTEGGWDLAPLAPVGAALAQYRDSVAGSFDYRIASFRSGIRYLRGVQMCGLLLGGQYPPDGTTWSRCVALAGNPVCATGDAEIGVRELVLQAPEHDAYLTSCFAP